MRLFLDDSHRGQPSACQHHRLYSRLFLFFPISQALAKQVLVVRAKYPDAVDMTNLSIQGATLMQSGDLVIPLAPSRCGPIPLWRSRYGTKIIRLRWQCKSATDSDGIRAYALLRKVLPQRGSLAIGCRWCRLFATFHSRRSPSPREKVAAPLHALQLCLSKCRALTVHHSWHWQ